MQPYNQLRRGAAGGAGGALGGAVAGAASSTTDHEGAEGSGLYVCSRITSSRRYASILEGMGTGLGWG